MLPPLEEFYPILIGTYIRYQTAGTLVNAQDEGKTEIPATKFKIAPEYYGQLKNCEIQSSLIGLNLEYDETSSILTSRPTPYFVEQYENKIMREVALKQDAENEGRYAKFIELLK